METKKNPKFDLEKKRGTFFIYGLIVSLMVVLLAFRGTSEVRETIELGKGVVVDVEVELVPVTYEKNTTVKPVKNFRLYNEFKVVENTFEMDDPEIIFDDPDDPVVDYIPYTDETTDDSLYTFVANAPDFPGGMKSLNKWLSRNLKYPNAAQEMNLQGKVYVNFEIAKDGTVKNVKVARGVAALLDEEAVRVVSAMPKWKPGYQNGKPVRVSYIIPVNFQLQQ